MPPFTLFGPGHLAAIAAIALVTFGLVALARRRRSSAGALRVVLAAGLLVAGAAVTGAYRRAGVPWRALLPLHLCDAAVFVAAWALLTLRPLASEVAYFWGASGTVLAVITPDLPVGPPTLEFFAYFAMHGAVIAAAFLLPFGLERVPRPHVVRRMLLVLNLYALAVAGIDFALGTNFLYLREKPPHPTPLDWFGPWPIYLLVAELVAFALFTALAAPFRHRA